MAAVPTELLPPDERVCAVEGCGEVLLRTREGPASVSSSLLCRPKMDGPSGTTASGGELGKGGSSGGGEFGSGGNSGTGEPGRG